MVRKIRNQPQANLDGFTLQMYRSKLASAARKEQQLTRLIGMISQEAKHGKKKAREPKNPKVWEAILQICDADKKKQKREMVLMVRRRKRKTRTETMMAICVYLATTNRNSNRKSKSFILRLLSLNPIYNEKELLVRKPNQGIEISGRS